MSIVSTIKPIPDIQVLGCSNLDAEMEIHKSCNKTFSFAFGGVPALKAALRYMRT